MRAKIVQVLEPVSKVLAFASSFKELAGSIRAVVGADSSGSKNVFLKPLLVSLTFLLPLQGCLPLKGMSPSDRQQVDKLVDQAVLHMREGDFEKAEAAFYVALEIGTSAAALDGLGCIYFMRGEYRAAENYFWRAYEVDGSYNTSLGNLALLYEVVGDRTRAKELYQRVLTEDPYNYRSRNNFAVFLAGDGKGADSARTELLKAQNLAAHPVIENNLENLEVRQ